MNKRLTEGLDTWKYQYWDDPSGETYAVAIKNGKPRYTSGPLYYKDVAENDPQEYNFDDPWSPEDDPDEWRLHSV